jgi:hypothetical protein
MKEAADLQSETELPRRLVAGHADLEHLCMEKKVHE